MMPQFTYPWALLLILFVPLLAWRYFTSPRGAWQYSDLRLWPSKRGMRAHIASWGGLVLRIGGLTLLIIALSGPRWPDDSSRLPTEGISIAMVVDVSASMNETDLAWDDTRVRRLVGVKKLFRLFVAGGKGPDGIELRGRPHDLIALVTFATHPETICPLTLEHSALLSIMEKLEPEDDPNKGTTNAGDAVGWALHALKSAPTRHKVLVFLTDGDSNVKGAMTPKQAAQLAAILSIPIYAIDVSPTEPKSKKELEEAERAKETLQTLAKMTGGRYFRAQDGRGMSEAYREIDQLARDRILSFQYRRFHEMFPWFALAALASWLTLIGLESTIWRRTP